MPTAAALLAELQSLWSQPDTDRAAENPDPPEAVTDDDRAAAHREAITEANRLYVASGCGPIDWPTVDAAAERIFSAGCRRELNAAVADYVRAVSPPEPVDELSEIASRLFPLDGSPPERNLFDELRDAEFPSE